MKHKVNAIKKYECNHKNKVHISHNCYTYLTRTQHCSSILNIDCLQKSVHKINLKNTQNNVIRNL